MTNGSKYDEYWRNKEQDDVMLYRDRKDNALRIIFAIVFFIAVLASQIKQK